MHFASDNWAGAHPLIAKRLAEESEAYAPAYGASELDRRIESMFNELFEREVAVFFVATGTAANSLALAAVNRAGGVAFCHRDAHMINDECGAPGFLSSGARLAPVDGKLGKIDPRQLQAEIDRFPADFVHAGRPMAVSITQCTELGTVYQPAEIEAITTIAKRHDLPVHMDGARFANALAYLNITPAQMSWRAGVDIVSFGATKNGCWCAEALVFMQPELAHDFLYLRKRSAQSFSKSRFIASQFEAYLSNDLWLDLARHANQMATALSLGITNSANAQLAWTPQSNEVFCSMSHAQAERLKRQGVTFHIWNKPHDQIDAPLEDDNCLIRLVTSFATQPEDIEQFLSLLNATDTF